jgi:hypothetical protein
LEIVSSDGIQLSVGASRDKLIELDFSRRHNEYSIYGINLLQSMRTMDTSNDVHSTNIVVKEIESGVERPSIAREGLESSSLTSSVTGDSAEVLEMITDQSHCKTVRDVQTSITEHST